MQEHRAIRARVVGVVDEVVQLQVEVLRHVQVPLQGKSCDHREMDDLCTVLQSGQCASRPVAHSR